MSALVKMVVVDILSS